jgi:serine/threonine-protein kinase
MASCSERWDHLRLGEFLHDRLPEDHRQEVEAHLLACPGCQERLDHLAGGEPWWSEVQRYLGDIGSTRASTAGDRPLARTTEGIDLDFLQPPDDPRALGRLGPYEVLGVIGRGGMGVVLKAFDPSLHRPVAIKVLAAEYAANGTARKRFAREAQAAAAVVHDHVVPVYAVDAGATPPYLVMAFLPGRSLQQRIDQDGPLELKEILRIGMQAAAGLAAAHAQGIVHRDIKPANIMLENGVERVRLTDFGLARAVDDASVTRSGAVAGTPQYMAPEQARGETVDQRADLFALGSTMYAMCTGHAPFHGDTGMAVLRQVSDAEPMPVRSLNSDVPAWLEGIIRKLHAKNPSRRFQSAAEVADLLERCLAHVQQPGLHPLPRPAVDLGRQLPGDMSRRISRRALAITAVAGLVAGMASVCWLVDPAGKVKHASPPVSPGNPSEPGPEAVQTGTREVSFEERMEAFKGKLHGLQHSLSSALPEEENGPVQPLFSLRLQAAQLERQFQESTAPSPDPMHAQLDHIRRRLEALRNQLAPDQK